MFQILLLLLFIIVLGWDVNGIVNSFNYHTIWDVVCANGLMFHGEYRDTYAFRTPSKYIVHTYIHTYIHFIYCNT